MAHAPSVLGWSPSVRHGRKRALAVPYNSVFLLSIIAHNGPQPVRRWRSLSESTSPSYRRREAPRMHGRGFFLTRQAIRRQLAAMPNELFLVRLIHSDTGRCCAGERLWTANLLTAESTIRFRAPATVRALTSTSILTPPAATPATS